MHHFAPLIITSSNYEQLGLKFRLFSAEVLFNKGLSQIYLGRLDEGLGDMQEARKDKATEEHNVIDDAIRDRGEGYTVFSIVRPSIFTVTPPSIDVFFQPVGVLYRPSDKKIKNTPTKDYMGKAVSFTSLFQRLAWLTFDLRNLLQPPTLQMHLRPSLG